MQPLIRGYETQVKVFMILVVLFLVTANLVTVTFLGRSEDLMVEEARARVLAATQTIARDLAGSGLAVPAPDAPGAANAAGARLAELRRAHAASVIEIVDASGLVLASSQSWRLGSRDPLESILPPAAAAGLRAGRPAVAGGGDEVSLTFVVLPLQGETGGAFLKAGYALSAAGAIRRQIRLLSWAQAIGGTVVLVMVLLFIRFVLRPYRALKEAAAGLQPAGAPAREGDDPAFLVASFRGVVDKMRGIEAELERMRGHGAAIAGRETLLSTLSSGVLILDADGAVAALNPAGEGILGVGAAEASGRNVAGLFQSSPEFSALLLDVCRSGRGRSREVVLYRLPSGRTAHLGVTASGPPGGGSGALCLFSDLTEIRGVQERVLFKENLARLGELSAGIAHEFRNSLATILGYARLAAREEPDPAGHAQAIIREVQAMERVVGEFLRYAGPARLQKAACDLRALVEEVGVEAARAGGGGVEVSVEGDWPGSVEADEMLLRQAIHNLVRNAVEAAASGTPPRRVRVRGMVDGGSVQIELTDSGPGFAPEVLPRLFTPFVSTKEKGTGLGLALAQKIVVSHDGVIDAGNASEGGARVRVTLPIGS